MRNQKNVFQRALEAIVKGRAREAQRYVDSFEAVYRIGRDRRS